MTTTILIHSTRLLAFEGFRRYLDIPNIVLNFCAKTSDGFSWCFHREDQSTTLFYIDFDRKGTYQVSIDNLAAYNDFKFFPYLVDTLAQYLQGTTDSENIYRTLNEEWIENTIAEEIAYLKAVLSLSKDYFITQPIVECSYVNLSALHNFGVNLHSSTPRIYGYIQYLMRHQLLPALKSWDELSEEEEEANNVDREVEVDIPQHEAIGRVKSWQLDGSETYETYSKEDVEHLLALASAYKEGKPLHGVVLNDIGTLHQEGIGIPVDGEAAIYWFTEAYKQGDTLYAPTNLGDLYRKGYGQVEACLEKALKAYRLSTDPYAHYRIGQAYEEGWVEAPNLELALKWYQQAAEEGHHLAIKRLKR